MSWFQNPLTAEFWGVWVIDDRAHHPTFTIRGNSGRGDEAVVAWGEPSGSDAMTRIYDLSGADADSNDHDTLNIRYAIGNDFLDWNDLAIDLTDNTNASLDPVPVASAMRPFQIVAILNAHPTFSAYFTASLETFGGATFRDRLFIRQKFDATRMLFFILNGQAEEILLFNQRAGVAELPTYFERHTIFNRDATTGLVAFEDGANHLVLLDPEDSGGSLEVDDDVISNAVDKDGNNLGFDPSVTQDDWQLLEGQSPTFLFTNNSAAAASSTTTSIVYPAGAAVGDLAKRIVQELDGSGEVLREFILPHTLVSADLITPP